MTHRQYLVYNGAELIGHVAADDQAAAMKAAARLYPHAEELRLVMVKPAQDAAEDSAQPEEDAAVPPAMPPRPRKRRTG